MNPKIDIHKVSAFFEDALQTYGASPQGVNWNSTTSQIARFEQLIKVCDLSVPFSINDYGCGCGALIEYLDEKGAKFTYAGYDISEKMIAQANETYRERPGCVFTAREADLTLADYTVESGVFNIRFEYETEKWIEYVLQTLHKMDTLSAKGFAFNMLTQYSDPERMRPELYYANPCYYFDYCKRNFSHNVALLHDYQLYDFTILVRK